MNRITQHAKSFVPRLDRSVTRGDVPPLENVERLDRHPEPVEEYSIRNSY